VGQNCDMCAADSYYFGRENGCLQCVCMGITDQCDSYGLSATMVKSLTINPLPPLTT